MKMLQSLSLSLIEKREREREKREREERDSLLQGTIGGKKLTKSDYCIIGSKFNELSDFIIRLSV